MSDTTKQVWVIGTHDGCRDGHVASIIAKKYYKENTPKDIEILYWLFNPSRREEGLEKLWKYCEENNYKIEKIYMFDVAFGPKHLDDMLDKCTTDDVKIFDHHVSSEREFNESDKSYNNKYMYDVMECGASLAWKFYYPEKEIPKFLGYIRDRDLWITEQPNSVEVNEYLFVTSPDFSDVDGWLKYFDIEDEDEYFKIATEVGKTLLKMKQKNVEMMYRGGGLRRLYNKNAYVVNTSLYQSDIGNYAVNKKDDDGNYLYDYAIIWRYNESSSTYYVSFRSRGDVDVSVISKKYNGGGHKAAAGCELDDIQELLGDMRPAVIINPKAY